MSETNKRGWLDNVLFAALLLLAFGASTYICFNFFIRGRSVSTPNLVGRSVVNAKAVCSDLGVNLVVDTEHVRNSDKIKTGDVVWQNRTPGATNLVKRGTAAFPLPGVARRRPGDPEMGQGAGQFCLQHAQVVRPRRLSSGRPAEERVEGFPQPDRTAQDVLCPGRNPGGGLA